MRYLCHIVCIFLIYFCVSISVTIANSDPTGLIVTIVEQNTKERLIGVAVICPERGFSSATDTRGQVNLFNVNMSDTLSFTYLGYAPVNVTVADILNQGGVVEMKPTVFNTQQIVLKGQTKFKEHTENIPSQLDIIDAKSIALLNPQTTTDALANSGNVFIQKSQMGGGSPVIRGFEANKVLLVIDGVRMNNAIYRSGHLQNAITIDNAILERAEVVYGPASVVYGSDALGGVMHFTTRRPRMQLKKGRNIQPIRSLNAYTRFSSTNLEKTVHADFNYGRENWGSLTSVTFSDFDDLRSGRLKHSDYPEFGDRNFYVQNINGQDSIVSNDNPRKQIGTGYSQLDVVQKFIYQHDDNTSMGLNIQYSTSSDVPRYDQLIDGSIEVIDGIEQQTFKFAEWYYGPQNRLLTAFNLRNNNDDNRFYNSLDLTVAYQNIEEDRISRRFGSNGRIAQFETVDVYSINADFVKKLSENEESKKRLVYGFELNHNNVASEAFEEDISTGESIPAITRYPDGGSTMSTFGAYLNFKQNLLQQVNVLAGIRYTYTAIQSNFANTDVIQLPYTEISSNVSALTGSFGATWNLKNDWVINGVASTAFRSPNVDDFGKIRAKGDFVTVPNPNLKAEYALNAEMNITKTLLIKDHRLTISGTGFYTYMFDAIVRENTTLNGSNILVYDGDSLFTQWNTNAGTAFIAGASANVAYKEGAWEFKSSINYTYGRNTEDDRPLAHIPPIYGQTSIGYNDKDKPWEGSFIVRYNGWKDIEDFSMDGTDNYELATPDGTPAWYTLNLYGSYKLTDNLTANLAVENILDLHYRPFASGVSAAGRNFIVTLRARF